MQEQLDDRQARIARNEAVFREANEQIDVLSASAELDDFPIVCECGSMSCADVFEVSRAVYNDVRGNPAWFLLRPGHEATDVETVVARDDGYIVVEKKPGAAERVAVATDPRAQGDSAVDDATARRIAENEARFRDANERIEDAVLRLEADAPTVPFVCECGRAECVQTIRLTIGEYESARENARYFLCEPGHQIVGDELGRVVRDADRFVIVEKLGVAGQVADERYTRSDSPRASDPAM